VLSSDGYHTIVVSKCQIKQSTFLLYTYYGRKGCKKRTVCVFLKVDIIVNDSLD